MADEKKVEQLAHTLKRNGLAASMHEAIEKAKSILGIGSSRPVKSEFSQKPETSPASMAARPDLDQDVEQSLTSELQAQAEEQAIAQAQEQQARLGAGDPSYDITKETRTLSEIYGQQGDARQQGSGQQGIKQQGQKMPKPEKREEKLSFPKDEEEELAIAEKEELYLADSVNTLSKMVDSLSEQGGQGDISHEPLDEKIKKEIKEDIKKEMDSEQQQATNAGAEMVKTDEELAAEKESDDFTDKEYFDKSFGRGGKEFRKKQDPAPDDKAKEEEYSPVPEPPPADKAESD